MWAKFRRLAHKHGIYDYVREFTELMLEIPDMREADAFFTFIDDLKLWVKLELQHRGIQELSEALSVVKSFMEFSREDKIDSSKSKHEGKDEEARESPSKKRPKSPSNRRNLNKESSKANKVLPL